VAVHRVLLDHVLDLLAWLVGHGLYRTVDVVGADRVPRDRPVIIVANHFNGLVDAVLLAVIARGVPRFIAKATLWRSPLLRPLLALAGLVPVSRPEDRDAAADQPPETNVASFERACELLRRRGTLAIFPEGTTHDRLELARVRTGAARIALSARASGIHGVTIVPIGLTFDDKLALRSRVLARIGDPLDLDAWVTHGRSGEAAADGDRAAVRELTETIRRRLSEVTPRYADMLERAILGRAADVRLRNDLDGPGRIVRLGAREALAQRMADAPAGATDAVVTAQGAYQLRLDLLRLRDEHLIPPLQRRWLLRRALALTAYIAVLGVVVLAGIAVNAVPTLVTAAAGRRARAPATKGTVRVLTALVVFPLVWVAVAIALPMTGVVPTALAVVACPVVGAITVGGLERTIALVRAWAGWLGFRNAGDLLPALHAARARVCQEVDRATVTAPDRRRASSDPDATPSPG
jgi:1-acyl-sn-glycerol-3-phosphate acyltransferase